MKPLDTINFAEAYASYAVANTPLFLVRKLRDDDAVREVSRQLTSDEILQALKLSIEHRPLDIDSTIRPYVLLVALYMKPTIDGLVEAKELSAPHWRWFAQIRDHLLATYYEVDVQKVTIQSALVGSVRQLRTRPSRSQTALHPTQLTQATPHVG